MFRRRLPKGIILVLLGLFLVIAAFPFVFVQTERIPITDATRAEAFKGETFAKLTDGYTHYIWSGPDTGRTVVLVHGFSSPCFIWEKQAEALAAEGYHVLRYDLFGRGHSDRPDTAYTPELYQRQLDELLEAQQVQFPIDIFGLSMGGPITVRYVDTHPERVRSFGLIAPAGFSVNVPAYTSILRVPGLSNWLIQAFGDYLLKSSLVKMATNSPELLQSLQEQYADQLQYTGYKRALFSTMLNHPMSGLDDLYARVGKLGKPSILFWGDADALVPYANNEKVRATIPNIEFHTIPEGSHTPNFESPGAVNLPLIAFLKAH